MKLYTRTGDDGSTALLGGQRVSKASRHVEAAGTIDELNSALGLAAALCQGDELRAMLHTIQHRLFDLGADLATPNQPDQTRRLHSDAIKDAERMIDQLCEKLEPLQQFILPGGSVLAAHLHLARVICRRAERLCVALSKQEPIHELAVPYLNRLSDLLFALARRANQLEGIADMPWLNAPQP